MKFTLFSRLSLILMTAIVFSMTSIAQSGNLLSNPGFEDGFRQVQGSSPREVANAWTPWNAPRTSDMPGFQNVQPTYFAGANASSQGAISRIRSGGNSQVYFSYFATHDAGIYQQISNVTSGTEFRFSIYGYVLSTSLDDLNVSENPGGVALRVGIDPTGGTDPLASSVVYSEAAIFYDAFRQYSVIATAQSTTITVFIRSTVTEPVQYSYVYLDDAVLEITPSSQPASTSTSTRAATATTAPTNTVAPANTTAAPTNTVAPTNTTAPTNTVAPANTSESVDATPTRETSSDGTVPTATQASAIATATQSSSTVATATQATSPVTTPVVPISDSFPGRILHTVQRGDTVGNLATLYGSSIEAIIAANGLDESALIFRGQGLIIPVRLLPMTETPSPTPLVVVITATPAPGSAVGGQYIVQRGDTLGSIASRFNTTVVTLVQLNGIANPNRIFVGQSIRLPQGNTPAPLPPTQVVAPTQVSAQPTQVILPTQVPAQPATYVVQPGDNLFRLALRFGVRLQDLAAANNLSDFNRIFIGQVLVIPR